MTRKELIDIVNAQLPKGEKCVSVKHTHFSRNDVENGAHLLGVLTSDNRYIMAWFTLRNVDDTIHNIILIQDDRTGDWELRIKDK